MKMVLGKDIGLELVETLTERSDRKFHVEIRKGRGDPCLVKEDWMGETFGLLANYSYFVQRMLMLQVSFPYRF